jgi:LysR family carnitine catabolism transcriptional activator
MKVTIKQLQAFVTVAKSGSFAEACIRLHLSQPALSIPIKNLEQAVGGKLPERFTRAVAAEAMMTVISDWVGTGDS